MTTKSRRPWLPPELDSRQRQLDPFSWFREMRERSPVRFDRQRGTVDVFRYEDVCEVAADVESFTRKGTSYIEDHMGAVNPPLHKELRSGLSGSFTPRSVENYRSNIRDRAEDIVADALDGDDTVAFVEDIAKPLPIRVIADLLGVPTSELDTFREWSTILASSPVADSERARREHEERQAAALSELKSFFRRELEQRESDPREDLITTVLRMEQSSERIERGNTIAQCAHLLIAGNVTTTEFMTNAIWTILAEDCLDPLKDGRLHIGDVLDEVLRYRPSVLPAKRMTTEPVQIGRTDVPAGTRVSGWLGSANRDERVFEDPARFDPRRDPEKQPIPFGTGVRHCLGSSLAQVEGEVVLSTFIDSITSAEITTDRIEPFYSNEVYGPLELPLRVVR